MKKTFEELAVELAQLCKRCEELNDEWDSVQTQISAVIEALRYVPEADATVTAVVPIPDHVRLRRTEQTQAAPATFAWNPLATEVGQSAIVPCPDAGHSAQVRCFEVAPHFHTTDGGIHPRPVLEGVLKED